MHTTVAIPGICCDSCVRVIRSVSSLYPQILHLNIDLTSKRVMLRHTEEFDEAAWAALLEERGEKYKIIHVS